MNRVICLLRYLFIGVKKNIFTVCIFLYDTVQLGHFIFGVYDRKLRLILTLIIPKDRG